MCAELAFDDSARARAEETRERREKRQAKAVVFFTRARPRDNERTGLATHPVKFGFVRSRYLSNKPRARALCKSETRTRCSSARGAVSLFAEQRRRRRRRRPKTAAIALSLLSLKHNHNHM